MTKECEFEHLPVKGRCAIGYVNGGKAGVIGVRESARYPGYYDIACIDLDNDDFERTKRPVRSDGILSMLTHLTRIERNLLDVSIEWFDKPARDWEPFAVEMTA